VPIKQLYGQIAWLVKLLYSMTLNYGSLMLHCKSEATFWEHLNYDVTLQTISVWVFNVGIVS